MLLLLQNIFLEYNSMLFNCFRYLLTIKNQTLFTIVEFFLIYKLFSDCQILASCKQNYFIKNTTLPPEYKEKKKISKGIEIIEIT